MWEDSLEALLALKERFSEPINSGASDEEIAVLQTIAQESFGVTLPEEYETILKKINGVEFNGCTLYGIDDSMLATKKVESIAEIVAENKELHQYDGQNEYFFFGEDNISWYAYKMETDTYWVIDNPSGEEMDFFETIGELIDELFKVAIQ